jgi:hypothetical protein
MSRKQRRSHQAWQFLLIVAACATLAVLGVLLLGQYHVLNSGDSSLLQSPVVAAVDKGVVWLGEPQAVKNDMKVFTLEPDTFTADGAPASIRYYKLGSEGSADIFLAVAPPIDPSGDRHIIFTKNGSKYEIIGANSDMYDTAQGQYFGPPHGKDVTLNTAKSYQSIIAPKVLQVSGQVLVHGYGKSQLVGDDLTKSGEKFSLRQRAVLPEGVLYDYMVAKPVLSTDTYEPTGQTLPLHEFLLKLPDGQYAEYHFTPVFMADDNVPQITWNAGGKNTDTYRWDGVGGCGAPGFAGILDSADSNNIVVAGTTSNGEAVYLPKNTDSATLKLYYDQLPNHTYYQYNEKNGEGKNIPISLQEYLDKRGIFIYRDPFGRNIVFQSLTYGPGAECGKPVIYLYPEKTTPVSVQVAAHVTASEPDYGTGWKVVAQPNGQLTNTDAVSYSSLFWEGLGKGPYPEVNAGFIVRSQDIEQTLRTHLAQLGLTAKESQDFLDFWLPKMPTTPYVRLTWFGTKEMNRLAPLNIIPAPDSLIRVFLDFQGLQQPMNLPLQTLSVIPRRGFTVVEWGGLLK